MTKRNIKQLVLFTAHDQFFQSFLTAKTLQVHGIPEEIDIVYYANSTIWSVAELRELFAVTLPHHRIEIVTTAKNIGKRWGAWESINDAYEYWSDYDIVYQCHPDIYFRKGLYPLISDALTNPHTFVFYRWPWGISAGIAAIFFMWFSFKPKQLRDQSFFDRYQDETLTQEYPWPETLLEECTRLENESVFVVEDWKDKSGIDNRMMQSRTSEEIRQFEIPECVQLTEGDREYLEKLIRMIVEKEAAGLIDSCA